MINQKLYKKCEEGDIYSFDLENSSGARMRVTNYGATITSIKVPDKNGKLKEVLLGFDDIGRYMEEHPFFGCTVGRFANRIKNGKFSLNGKEYQLNCNDGKNHLHGGPQGFWRKVWSPDIQDNKLCLEYNSPDGDENYPSELVAKVCFSLTDDNEVVIEYEAQSDGDTIVNLTNHAYFNFNESKSNILNHVLTVKGESFIETDAECIPSGKIKNVSGTSLDFRSAKEIGAEIEMDEYVKVQNGYDCCFVLRENGYRKAADVLEKQSGIKMEVFTDQPALQFFTGQNIDHIEGGNDGSVYELYGGLCLETQGYPDAPNHADFPSCVLKKGEVFQSKTVYKFTVD